MPEESGLPFASKDPKAAHCCGHDMHATMLLGAAKMLKEHESELKGTVKLMFQPGEECLNGSLNMLEHGILENPKVDAALAYHVGPGQLPIGMFMYNDNSTMMFSNNSLKIKVKGKGGHGALPQNCIDPISIGAHIIIALQEIIAREFDPHDACVITVGTFHAGTAMNIIPEEAELTGTLRADTKEAQQKLMKRVKEVAEATAKVYGADTEVEISAGGPPLICDPSTTKEFVGYMRELKLPETMEYPNISASASEDFAFVAEQVPSTFMYLSSGYMDERGAYSCLLYTSSIHAHVSKLDKLLRNLLTERHIDFKINGDSANRAAGILNISILGIEGEGLLNMLDMHDICISVGSACNSKSQDRSHVLLAMGLDEEYIDSSVRISIGRYNTEEDIRTLVKWISNYYKIAKIMEA